MRNLSQFTKWLLPAPSLVHPRRKHSGGSLAISLLSKRDEVWNQKQAKRGVPKRPPSLISSARSGRSPEQRKKKTRTEWRSRTRKMKRRKQKRIPALLLESQLLRRHLFLVRHRWGAKRCLPAELSERGNPSLLFCYLDQQQGVLMPETRWACVEFYICMYICLEGYSLLCCCWFQKQFEGQHSFEQKLHLMLQRIGVSKAQPGETQVCGCFH